jgi:hypothetical protein
MANKTRIAVGFTAPQMDWLRQEAARLGISLADLVRRILDEHRAGKGK